MADQSHKSMTAFLCALSDLYLVPPAPRPPVTWAPLLLGSEARDSFLRALFPTRSASQTQAGGTELWTSVETATFNVDVTKRNRRSLSEYIYILLESVTQGIPFLGMHPKAHSSSSCTPSQERRSCVRGVLPAASARVQVGLRAVGGKIHAVI